MPKLKPFVVTVKEIWFREVHIRAKDEIDAKDRVAAGKGHHPPQSVGLEETLCSDTWDVREDEDA